MNTKFLFSSNFKAIRAGAFVEAAESAGEFIVDFADVKMTKGQLEEIVNANKLSVSSKLRVDEYAQKICEGLQSLKLPEVSKMTESATVLSIVKAGFEAGKTEDLIMIEIMQAGIGFKKAGKLYAQAVVEAGLRASPKELKETVFEKLTSVNFAPKAWGEVEAMAKVIAEENDHCDEKQALGYIKRWASANEVSIPKRAKAPRIGKILGVSGFGATILHKLIGNPQTTMEELVEFIETKKPDYEDDRVKRVAERFYRYVAFHNAIVNGAAPVAEYAESDSDLDEEADEE